MKYLICFYTIFISISLFAQEKKSKIYFQSGIGFQSLINSIKPNNTIEYEGFEYNPLLDIFTSGVFVDLGIDVKLKSHHLGAGVRIAQSEQWNFETVGYNFLIDFLPRGWYSYYFGKQDKQAFRADFSLMLDWEKKGVIYDPVNPSAIPNNPLYVCFGPQVGTRIIRKGAFANTYLIGGPVFAPPVKFDSYIGDDPGWNIRWMIGLSKSLSFKKSSK